MSAIKDLISGPKIDKPPPAPSVPTEATDSTSFASGADFNRGFKSLASAGKLKRKAKTVKSSITG